MTACAEIVDIVLPVFFIIGIGYALGALRFINAELHVFLSRLVFYLAAPALLFRSTALASLHEAIDAGVLLLVVGTTIFLVLAAYIGSARIGAARRGVFTQGTHRSNMVFVGLPVIINAYGEGVLASAAVLIGVMVVVYNFLAVLVLVLPHGRDGSGGRALWIGTGLKIVRNPLILASGAGILFSASGGVLPACADRTLDLVGRIAMPLALLSVGASLDFGRLRSEIGPAAIVCFLKLIVYPALVYAGLTLIGVSGTELEVPVLIMAAPTAVVSYIMAQEMKGDEQLAAAIVIGTTIASLFTISAWLIFFTVAG